MKRLVIYFGILTLTLLGAERLCHAANVNVADAAGFRAALIAAENNGQPDTINLQAGNYNNGTLTFAYTAAAGENQPLTILGAGRDVVTLDGASAGTILFIDTATNNAGADGNADVLVQGIGFKNSGGDAVAIKADQADATVQQNNFNMVDIGATSLITSTGNLNILSNIFDNNFIGTLASVNMGIYTLQDNQFSNQANNAVAFLSSNKANILGNTINGNPASGSSAIAFNVTGSILIDSNTILNNVTTSDGAGLNGAVTGSLVMTNNISSGNASTAGDGGAVFLVIAGSGPLTITNNTVTNNSTTGFAGGIGLDINDPMIVTNIYNNIIFGNTAPAGQGADIVVADSDDPLNGSPVNLFNNDFTDFFSACQFLGPPCVPNIMGLTPDTNLNADPLFANPAAGDFNLLLNSPAIGAGDPAAPNLPAVDNVGNPLNDPPDLGALAANVTVTADPTALDFGTLAITQSNSLDVTVTNNGVTTLKVGSTDLSDNQNYTVDFGSCGGGGVFDLDPGASCTLTVTFSPANGGTFNATLTINSNDPATPALVITMTGIGVGPNGCALAAEPGSFTSMGGFLLLGIVLVGMKLKLH